MSERSPNDVKVTDPIRPRALGASLISGFLGTARAVLLRPRSFFADMPVEGGLLGPYVFFLLCTSFSFFFSLILNAAATKRFDPWILVMFGLALGMPFVSAALLRIFLTKFFGTSGSYEATFRVVCYANAVNLLAWIPLLVILVLLQCYEIYLSALGLSVVHRTTIGRAVLAIVTMVLTVSFILALLAQLFFSS
jgi:hypothetical protein